MRGHLDHEKHNRQRQFVVLWWHSQWKPFKSDVCGCTLVVVLVACACCFVVVFVLRASGVRVSVHVRTCAFVCVCSCVCMFVCVCVLRVRKVHVRVHKSVCVYKFALACAHALHLRLSALWTWALNFSIFLVLFKDSSLLDGNIRLRSVFGASAPAHQQSEWCHHMSLDKCMLFVVKYSSSSFLAIPAFYSPQHPHNKRISPPREYTCLEALARRWH